MAQGCGAIGVAEDTGQCLDIDAEPASLLSSEDIAGPHVLDRKPFSMTSPDLGVRGFVTQ